jgi:hypothetical protein
MTGVDVLVTMMLMGCVESAPVEVRKERTITVTFYECPLIGDKAVFGVWRRVCSPSESHGLMLKDYRTGKGFHNNQFGELAPAYQNVDEQDTYSPPCTTEPDINER